MLSVVIPTYERPASLGRLLHALEQQGAGGEDLEVVVVDDGSTAGDVAGVVARHATVRYLRQDNAGPAAARNRGWRAAAGDVIAFTDDDTVPTPTWAADLLAAFAADPAIDAVGGGIVPLVAGPMARFSQLEHHVDHQVGDDGSVRYLVTANCAWRRPVLEQLGGFDEHFPAASGEDTDLTLRAVEAGFRLATIDGAVVAHDNPTSLTTILRTYHRHGRSRAQIVAAHPGAGWGRRRRAVLAPGYWTDRYRYYRAAGCGAGQAAMYTAVRLLGLAWYTAGIAASRFDRGSS